jgi:hypothetical protein
MAKNLVDLIDHHREDQRFYLFVSPHAKDPDANDSFHEANADYVHLIKRLMDVVLRQSGFQDWITAQGLNKRVALLDERATGLKNAMLSGDIDVPALATTADSLLKLFFPDGEHRPPGAIEPETLESARDRIAMQYRSEMAELGEQAGKPEAFRDSVLAFESAAGLGARDLMTIYGITAMDSELAGAGLQAFLGFFDQRFRDHDYDLGRSHARRVLMDPTLAEKGAIGPINYTGSPIHPIDERLDGLKLSAVPAADVERFKSGLRDRVKQMAKQLLGPYILGSSRPTHRFGCKRGDKSHNCKIITVGWAYAVPKRVPSIVGQRFWWRSSQVLCGIARWRLFFCAQPHEIRQPPADEWRIGRIRRPLNIEPARTLVIPE